MIFEPAHLKSAGNKSSQTSSTFQRAVYVQGWEGHNTALTLETSQIVESWLLKTLDDLLPMLFKSTGSKIIRQHNVMIKC